MTGEPEETLGETITEHLTVPCPFEFEKYTLSRLLSLCRVATTFGNAFYREQTVSTVRKKRNCKCQLHR